MAELPTFAAFFRQTWGYEPFPWQQQLAERFRTGTYPDSIDVPTAAGKSAVVDAHLWALAVNPELRRRLFVIIDRRVLVDQIVDRANHIIGVCAQADVDSPAGQVRARLAGLSAGLPGDDRFAVAFSLRGGDDTDPTGWVARPDLPAIIASTVDQAGSAALHRPYRMSARTAPMAAATFTDAVVVVDEAQLAVPAITTFRQLGRMWRGDGDLLWAQPPVVIATTATHVGDVAGSTIRLTGDDHDHPQLRRRLTTRRYVTAGSKKSGPAVLRNEAQTLMAALTADGHDSPSVAVVCNTVAQAVAVSHQLQKDAPDATVVRLTGRQRPADRTAAARLLRSVLVGGPRDLGPMFVVATQTIECGVDLDVDAMATVAAPWPNLIQRFGRVNRTGRLNQSHIVVVEATAVTAGPYPHDVTKAAHGWLAERGPVDLCPNQIVQHDLASDLAVQPVPGLADSLVNTWASNLPDDACAPLAPYLHGLPEQPDRDVDIVWRDTLQSSSDNSWWADLVAAAPPDPAERCPVPIGQAVRWLHPDRDRPRPWVRLRRGQPPTVVTDRPAPGDVIIVPAAYSGADQWGWTGVDDGPAVDVSGIRTCAGVPPDDTGWWQPIVVPEPIDGLTGPYVDDDADGIELHIVSVQPGTVDSLDLDDADQRSRAGRPISLNGHQADTAARANAIAHSLRLGTEEQQAVTLAARWHDHGKTDPRFQTYLGNQDGAPVGKSGSTYTWAQHRTRWATAGLPAGWRHEAESVTANVFDGWDKPDSPTVVRLGAYLAGVHHGHGRPLWPAVADGPDLQATYSSRWVELRDDLVRRYGPWRLALLETIVRAADWSASAHAEQD